jgi:hypothetical protein
VEVANVRTLKLQVHDADPGYVAMKLGKGDNGPFHASAVPVRVVLPPKRDNNAPDTSRASYWGDGLVRSEP